jgi:predicted Zn-ribbon and HTH transcriptional regulator
MADTLRAAKIKMDGWKCERCGHKWVPRIKIKERPTICPRCKSPYWDRRRKTFRESE